MGVMFNHLGLAGLLSCTIALSAAAESININIVDLIDERNEFLEGDYCNIEYEISNNSVGTIYLLRVAIDAWDDRGQKLDEMLSSSIENGGGFAGYTPIPVGSTSRFEIDSGFKVRCKYLAKIQIVELKPEYCNVRMLPEDTNCRSLLNFESSVDGVDIE